MRKKKVRKFEWSALDLAHGGKAVPANSIRRYLAGTQDRVEGLIKEKSKLYQEAARYRRKLRRPSAAGGKDPEVARAVEGLRKFTNRLQKRKVIAPAVAKLAPGILAGSYAVRLTPPYDFANVFISAGAPKAAGNSAFARRHAGEMGWSISAATKENQNPVAITEIGAFFIPMFGPALLRASVNPAVSFAWWINSLGFVAETHASMSFGITAFRKDGTEDFGIPRTGGSIGLWSERDGDVLKFDFGSNSDNPMSASIEVDTNHFYLVSVRCLGVAFAKGWEGRFASQAGGILSIAVPFIDLDLRLIPVVSQAL